MVSQSSFRLVASALALSLCLPALADDAQALYDQAQAAYANRTSAESVASGLQALNEAETKVDDDDLKYDILILRSRFIFWRGTHTADASAKLQIFDQGMAAANQAKELNGDYAEAYYYYAINLGEWALAKGIMESLSRKGELVENLDGAKAGTTRDGKNGEVVDGYGPDRVLGRLYFKLPVLAGGSHAKSVKYLQNAYDNDKTNSRTYVYYGETLLNGNASEQALGKQVLNELISADPNTLDPTRVPETLEDVATAKALLQGA